MNESSFDRIESLKKWAESAGAPARIFVYLNEIESELKDLVERRANERTAYVDAWQKGFNAGADWQKGAKSAESGDNQKMVR